jgi:Uma2 family endonuclease
MTLAVSMPPPSPPLVLRNVSWDFYEATLRETEGQHLYITYFQRMMEIMPPSNFHERYKSVIGRMIETLALELRIRLASCGSTTWRRMNVEAGLEPDESYYVQNEPRVRTNFHIDLANDPPPDLAIEMDYTHHVVDREQVYAALGVPEVWRFDGKTLEVLVLDGSGSYQPASQRPAFPFLPMREFERFLLSSLETSEADTIFQFQDWVRANLKRP